jgi:hypothetical protein
MTQEVYSTKIIRVLNAVAAGTSVQTGAAVDLAGFEGVRFIIALGVGSASSVGQIKASQCATSGGSYADILGSLGTAFTATTDDNKLWILDIYRPTKRFVKCIVNRATGNTVIDGVIAELYGPRIKPTIDDATTVLGRKILVSPAEGTA